MLNPDELGMCRSIGQRKITRTSIASIVSQQWAGYTIYHFLTISKALLRETDSKIMFMAAVSFSALNLHRGNLGQANSASFLSDLHLTTNGNYQQSPTFLKVSNESTIFLGSDFNTGNTIFRLAFLFAELPSQLISQRVCLWSVVSLGQFWLTGRASFLACRGLLGCDGFPFIFLQFPDIVHNRLLQGGYDIAIYFYTKTELPIRLAGFWMVLLEKLDGGKSFLCTMRMLLICDCSATVTLLKYTNRGLIMLAVGIASFFNMPPSPTQTRMWFRPKGWFTEREESIIVNKVLRDDPTKGDMHSRQELSPKRLWIAIRDYDLWPVYILGLAFGMPSSTPSTYLTLSLTATCRASVGHYIGVFREGSLLGELESHLSVIKAHAFKVFSLQPYQRDGGVFVRFTYSASDKESALKDIEDELREEADKHTMPSWAGLDRENVWLVKGQPWLEDMNRYPFPLVKVEFEGPDIQEETPPFSLVQQPYGRIRDLTPKPALTEALCSADVSFVHVRSAAIARNAIHGHQFPNGNQPTRLTRLTGHNTPPECTTMVSVHAESPEIARASLHVALTWYTHIYTFPFLSLYPLLAYAYYSEEWTFLACVSLGAGHALSFLVTRWSSGAKAWITTRTASSIEDADCIRLVPHQHHGQGEIVPLVKRIPSQPMSYTFSYQRDTYVVAKPSPVAFTRLPYPCTSRPPFSDFLAPPGLATKQIDPLKSLYGKNEFNILVPSFAELFGEHATTPFFVFQIFCVALWCLDEYWYYGIFTLLMLVMFECTVVWQRLKTLTEFWTMSVAPYPIQCPRDSKWTTVQTDELLPGDVPVTHLQSETVVPADILLAHGTCIVNEAMLSGESIPLLKESIQLLDASDKVDVDGAHKNEVLFSGTKVLQASPTSQRQTSAGTRDGGCLGIVLRTGFGTAQGQLVRKMIFSTERVSANNLESFLFIGFLLIFAMAASWYVWVKGAS
ncbi:hypothetical protein J3R83DRAFT_5501 [Lanmaoa asiatica]|nr:hypothetical protein J3R83DRAFT_5501 [Lanmaoa asiatica]